jgi:hypothetical protein
MTLRADIVATCQWGVSHSAEMPYTENGDPAEGVTRSAWLSKPAYSLPLDTDCSGWSIVVLKWNGVDVSHLVPSGWLGYTGTFLAVGQHIHVSEVQPGDFAVYGGGTGCHMAPIVAGGSDPLTASHGSAGVHLINVSRGCPPAGFVNGRPVVTYVRIVPPDAPAHPAVATVAKAIAHPIVAAKKVVAKVTPNPRLVPSGSIVANPNGPGDFYVRNGKKAGIPSPAERVSLVNRGAVIDKRMPAATIEALPVVKYGSN